MAELTHRDKLSIERTYKIRTFIKNYGRRRTLRINWVNYNIKPHINSMAELLVELGKHPEALETEFFAVVSSTVIIGMVLIEMQHHEVLSIGELTHMGKLADILLRDTEVVYSKLLQKIKVKYGNIKGDE